MVFTKINSYRTNMIPQAHLTLPFRSLIAWNLRYSVFLPPLRAVVNGSSVSVIFFFFLFLLRIVKNPRFAPMVAPCVISSIVHFLLHLHYCTVRVKADLWVKSFHTSWWLNWLTNWVKMTHLWITEVLHGQIESSQVY